MDKTQVLISHNWYTVGYPECAGCPHLIITHRVCDFERFASADCKYPDKRVLLPPPEGVDDAGDVVITP